MPRLFRSPGTLALGLAIAPVSAATLAAQSTPLPAVPTFEACYVPISGTVYRIDTPTAPAAGAPKACLSPTHVRFTWNQQGPAGATGPQGEKGEKGEKGDPGSGGAVGPDLTLPGTLTVGTSTLLNGPVTLGTPAGTSIGTQLLQMRDGPSGTGNFVFGVTPAGLLSARLFSLTSDALIGGRLSVGGGILAPNTTPLVIPSGSGTRLLWAPQKAAFRAGAAQGSEWDDSNVGPHSVAFGSANRASGQYSAAFGTSTFADGIGAVTFGQNARASGASAFAWGFNAVASGDYAMAGGLSTTASGSNAIAFGQSSVASGASAAALGNVTRATATGAFAFGQASQATGAFSFAGGQLNTASGANSVALGQRASTNGMAGTFLFADASMTTIFEAAAANEFAVRAAGGFRFRTATDLTTGCDIAAGSLRCSSGIVSGSQSLSTFTAPSGSGTRFLYEPNLGALRSGRVSGAQWDPVNIGFASFAAGEDVSASGHNSIALGSFVNTNGKRGTFMFGDSYNSPLEPFVATAANQFLVRAEGGVVFYSTGSLNTGVSLSTGSGAWQSVSDVHKKTAFRPLDGETVLAKLRAMPVQSWQYRTQDAAVRHIGPTAQDFRAAFGVGESDTTITTVDADGVALAGVKALEARTHTTAATLAQLRAENEELRQRVAQAERAIGALADLERRIASLQASLAVVQSTTAPALTRPARVRAPARSAPRGVLP